MQTYHDEVWREMMHLQKENKKNAFILADLTDILSQCCLKKVRLTRTWHC